jgi:heme/copper-type cytochrome/quinol oxidase subunit 4
MKIPTQRATEGEWTVIVWVFALFLIVPGVIALAIVFLGMAQDAKQKADILDLAFSALGGGILILCGFKWYRSRLD